MTDTHVLEKCRKSTEQRILCWSSPAPFEDKLWRHQQPGCVCCFMLEHSGCKVCNEEEADVSVMNIVVVISYPWVSVQFKIIYSCYSDIQAFICMVGEIGHRRKVQRKWRWSAWYWSVCSWKAGWFTNMIATTRRTHLRRILENRVP